jgi:hypothetical protein
VALAAKILGRTEQQLCIVRGVGIVACLAPVILNNTVQGAFICNIMTLGAKSCAIF